MSQHKYLRKQYFVDRKVQGMLLGRVTSYWFLCLITITVMLMCWQLLTGPARPIYTQFGTMWFHFGPAVIASFVLLPFILIDMVRISNRFAGPLVRLRRSMQALARGEQVKPIHFRKGDFWQELADDFNAVAARIQDDKLSDESNDFTSEHLETDHTDQEAELVGSSSE